MNLLKEAKRIAAERGFDPVCLDDPMCPDPIVLASQSEVFATLHAMMCLATGTDPAYISVRRVVGWLGSVPKTKSANA